MKKIVLLIALVLSSIVTNAQSFFDTLEDMDGVDVVVVNKDMFDLLSKFKSDKIKDNDAVKFFEMVDDLNEFKLFSTDNKAIASKMEAMMKTVVKKQNLTELMRIKEDDSRIKVYINGTKNNNYVKEVLMFIKGLSKKTNNISESTIISLTGNIDINKISELTDSIVKESNK